MIQIVSETEDFNANTEYEKMFDRLEGLVGSLQTEASKEGSKPVYTFLGGIAGFGGGYYVDFARTRIYATDAEYDNALRAFLKATGLDKRGFVLGEMATPTERLRVKEFFQSKIDQTVIFYNKEALQVFMNMIDEQGFVKPSFQDEWCDFQLKAQLDKIRETHKDLPKELTIKEGEILTPARRLKIQAYFKKYVGDIPVLYRDSELTDFVKYMEEHIDENGRGCNYNFDVEWNAAYGTCCDIEMKGRLNEIRAYAAESSYPNLPEALTIKEGEILTPERRLQIRDAYKSYLARNGLTEDETLLRFKDFLDDYITDKGEFCIVSRRMYNGGPRDFRLQIDTSPNGQRLALSQNISVWKSEPYDRDNKPNKAVTQYTRDELAGLRALDGYMIETTEPNGSIRKVRGASRKVGDLPVDIDTHDKPLEEVNRERSQIQKENAKAAKKAKSTANKNLVQPKRPVGGRLLGTFAGVGGGGALDYLLAPKTDYTPELVENGKISGLDGMKISPELIRQMNAYHDLGETGPAVVYGLAQKILDEGYVAEDETLGSALSYIVENKEKGYTFSDYVKTGTAHTKIKDTFEKVRLALQEIINKANDQTILECFGVEINVEMTREKLAEDVALKMMDGIFYQLLIDAEKHMEAEKQKHDSNDSDGDFFLLQYGERYIDPLEDTVFPSDKYNSRQA
ncbi:MAG: hypothetical protein IJY58_01890 [Alphaproteobacteria bacterium]|nr:hypothetical protein [Alphaproteobacteria bacterium]